MAKIKSMFVLLFIMIAVAFILWNQKKTPEVIQEVPPAEVQQEAEPEVVPETPSCTKCNHKTPAPVVKETPQPATVIVPVPQPVQPVIIVQPAPAPQPVQQPEEETPAQSDPPEEERELETRYTLTLPAGSPVNQPKDRMTLEELQFFTANLFKPHDSPYSKLLVATESELYDFLQSNGYKIEKEKI